MSTQMAVGATERDSTRSGKGITETLLDFFAEPVDAALSHEVFDACVLAVFAVAPVTEGLYDRRGDRNCLFRCDPRQGLAECRERRRLVVRHALAAANVDVESADPALVQECDKSQVLRQHIHAVVPRQGNTNLELAWEVGVAIERFFTLSRHSGNLLAI